MQLADLRNEVLAHGFDAGLFTSRINQYLNDAQNLVARRMDYYGSEASYDFSTTPGQGLYPWPTGLARLRSLRDTSRQIEMEAVGLRTIDRSATFNGVPSVYAISGANVLLYPTPDNIYPMELRYWQMPPVLVNDTDVPSLPVDWHHVLWVYAVWICYEAEDDANMGQYWKGRFENELSELTSDQKFPSTDYPTQVAGMWEGEKQISPLGWTYLGWDY